MRRLTLAFAAAGLLLLVLAPTALAQDGPELNVQCVSITGSPSSESWDESSLQNDIAAGAAALTAVSDSSDCDVSGDSAACVTIAGAAPVGGWAADTLTEAITAGRAQVVLVAPAEDCAQVTAETVEPPEALLPLEIVESGIVSGGFSSSFVAIVTNPNSEIWAAQGLPIAARALDGSGAELEVTSTFVSLLPGQTTAAVGSLTSPGKAHTVELTPEGADFNWLPTEVPADVLQVSGVKRPKDDVMGFATTGKIRNDGVVARDGVSVVAVHRNKVGKIIGAEFTLIESIPAGEAVTFELPNLSGLDRKQVAETEVYYQLGSVR